MKRFVRAAVAILDAGGVAEALAATGLKALLAAFAFASGVAPLDLVCTAVALLAAEIVTPAACRGLLAAETFASLGRT
jgi:hypothetical protein